jgi:sugar lactone lactonase YvrE
MVMPATSRPLHALSTAIVIMLATGCGGDGVETGPAGTGSLAINVNQAGTTPEPIHVVGPAGYTRAITSTTTLAGIPVGSYTISADSQEVEDAIVGATTYAPLITGSPATVTKNEVAQASVAYAFRHQRGALWIANVSGAVEQFGAAQLNSSGIIVPNTQGIVDHPNGLVFAANGDMWVSSLYTDTLRMYTIAARNNGNPIGESRRLLGHNLSIPEQMVFDASGTLWVADFNKGLVGFSAAQVAAGGIDILSAFSIQDTTLDSPGMQGIAIDGAGNVWVTEVNTSQVVEFSAAQLAQSGTIAPAVRLTSTFVNPSALAFDAHGNLWVTNENGFSIVMFTPAQLVASGAPAPTVKIDMRAPSGLAFDNSGDLWVSAKDDNEVHEYTPAQLLTTATPVPAVVLKRNQGILGPLAFDQWATPSLTPPPSGSIHVNRVSTKHASRAHS